MEMATSPFNPTLEVDGIALMNPQRKMRIGFICEFDIDDPNGLIELVEDQDVMREYRHSGAAGVHRVRVR